FAMDFPARPDAEAPVDPAVASVLGATPRAMLRGRGAVAIFDHADDVRSLRPDFSAMTGLSETAVVIATAPGDEAGVDFVSRFFAPALGVPEDPVTGSAHCTLAPYWSARLGKATLEARQLSARGGAITCTVRGDRVGLTGDAVLVVAGMLAI